MTLGQHLASVVLALLCVCFEYLYLLDHNTWSTSAIIWQTKHGASFFVSLFSVSFSTVLSFSTSVSIILTWFSWSCIYMDGWQKEVVKYKNVIKWPCELFVMYYSSLVEEKNVELSFFFKKTKQNQMFCLVEDLSIQPCYKASFVKGK